MAFIWVRTCITVYVNSVPKNSSFFSVANLLNCHDGRRRLGRMADILLELKLAKICLKLSSSAAHSLIDTTTIVLGISVTVFPHCHVVLQLL